MLFPGKPPSQRSERACEADFLSLCSSLRNPWDYVDYTDYTDDTPAGPCTKEGNPGEVPALLEPGESITVCTDGPILQRECHLQETAVINVINRNQCHQRNQVHGAVPPVDVQEVLPYEADQSARAEQRDTTPQRNRCPHHPRAQMVRFDPAGQAWCDRMDCWDCYRLMKIGEALCYRCLTDPGGRRLIEQGMEAWAAFVLTQRAFLVTWATQEALALCRALGVEEPELSGEVQHVVEVRPEPP